MASTNGENLIYIDSDDSLTIKYQNALINISEVNATVSNNSILSIIDKFFQIIYQKLSLRVIFKFNFASLFIKIIRTIVYLIKSILNRRLDYDDFNREVLSQDAGRKIIFKGIFCQIMLPEAGELGQAIIIPAQAKLQPVGFKVPKQMAKAVEVDRAFGKVFKSYASDPITAQTILSPVVRQYSIDYSRTSKSPIYLSVNGRMVYIGIVTPVQLLEPKIGKSMLEFSPVQDYYQAIKFITDIAATLIATSVEDQDRSIEQ